MSMNYYEKLVMDDKEKEGYDVIRIDEGGLPDFKIFNFETGERFWLEVKRHPAFYTEIQKKGFAEIKHKIVIALVEKGKITYKDYNTGEVISISSYSKLMVVTPNVTCKRCGHAWFTTSKMFFVTCPRCRKMVKIKEVADKSPQDIPRMSRVGSGGSL